MRGGLRRGVKRERTARTVRSLKFTSRSVCDCDVDLSDHQCDDQKLKWCYGVPPFPPLGDFQPLWNLPRLNCCMVRSERGYGPRLHVSSSSPGPSGASYQHGVAGGATIRAGLRMGSRGLVVAPRRGGGYSAVYVTLHGGIVENDVADPLEVVIVSVCPRHLTVQMVAGADANGKTFR